MAPAALHLIAGRLVAQVAVLLRRFEVTVLGIDDDIGVLAMVLEVTWTPKLAAAHRFHPTSPFS